MQPYLLVTPEEYSKIKGQYPFAHRAYRISERGLLCHNLLTRTRGGLMVLSDTGCPKVTHPDGMVRQIVSECHIREFSGVFADFLSDVDQSFFLTSLAEALHKTGKLLHVGEAYRHLSPEVSVLVSTALSGGSLKTYLAEKQQACGKGGFGLLCPRVSMDFTMPSPTGVGSPLTGESLSERMKQYGARPFFSTELCARYFTYKEKDAYHFVLYDDEDTLLKKLSLGENFGARLALFTYAEWYSSLARLFPAK